MIMDCASPYLGSVNEIYCNMHACAELKCMTKQEPVVAVCCERNVLKRRLYGKIGHLCIRCSEWLQKGDAKFSAFYDVLF